ncbi:Thioredoxin-like fold, partial [Trinorchestia longiramus]
EYNVPMGPKHKTPWITINGEDIADSEIIIQRLQKMFNKFPDTDLPKEERAVGVAMRVMLEEHFYWGLVSWRYSEDNTRGFVKVIKTSPLTHLALKVLQRTIAKMLYVQGVGRHSYDEIHHFMRKDLEAVSDYLGDVIF